MWWYEKLLRRCCADKKQEHLAPISFEVVTLYSDTPLSGAPAMLGTLPGSPTLKAYPAPSAMRFGSPPLCQNSDPSAWTSSWGRGRGRRVVESDNRVKFTLQAWQNWEWWVTAQGDNLDLAAKFKSGMVFAF